jgi:hypothetical protein
VPEDGADQGLRSRRGERKIFHALREKMDFAPVIASETLEQFGNGALRTMTAIHERRNNSEPQSSDLQCSMFFTNCAYRIHRAAHPIWNCEY